MLNLGRNWSIFEGAVKPFDARETNSNKYIGLEVDFSLIDILKASIDANKPFSRNLAKSLNEKLIVEWTYNSNAIGGNTLTISETKVVLEGITIGGKSIVEHLETINHREAILFLKEMVSNQEQLTEWSIKNLHALILKSIDDENAGKYRKENVLISGAKHMPLKHFELDYLMQKMIAEYNSE